MRHFRYIFLTAVIMFLFLASIGQAAVSHRDSGTQRKGAQVHHHHRQTKAAKHHRKAKGPTATKASAPVQTRRMPLVTSAPVPVVSGTTYYVSASGSDSHSGTSPSQ